MGTLQGGLDCLWGPADHEGQYIPLRVGRGEWELKRKV